MRPRKRTDYAAHLPVLEDQSQLAFMRPAIVADGRDISRARTRQRLNQIVRKARAAKSAEHDARAIGHASHRGVQAAINFLFHENSSRRQSVSPRSQRRTRQASRAKTQSVSY